jgi:cyanophycinase
MRSDSRRDCAHFQPRSSRALRWGLLGIGLAAALSAPMAAQAGKLFLSGGGYSDRNTDLFVQGLRKATGRDSAFVPNINSITNCSTDWATTTCPRIAVITAASATSTVGWDAYKNDLPATSTASLKRGYQNLFQTHGFSPRWISAHVDNRAVHASGNTAEGRANIAILEQADAVWIAGGDQAKIIRTFLNDDGSDTPVAAALRRAWNNGAGRIVIAGDSAGNHALNARMHGIGISYGYLYFGANLHDKAITDWANFGDSRDGTASLRWDDNGATMRAFGFLPSNLLTDTHFEARSGRLGRLAAALRHTRVSQGLGVDIDTGVLIDTAAQTAQVFGSGSLTVVDAAQASVSAGTYYRVNGLRVSLLTAGDRYNYGSRSVTSSKAAISRPYYSTAYDAANVFTPLESSKCITRVVDQTPSFNLCKAPPPVYTKGPQYPSGAPVITLRFTRDASTRGFFSNGAYTAAQVKLDIY